MQPVRPGRRSQKGDHVAARRIATELCLPSDAIIDEGHVTAAVGVRLVWRP